MSQPRSTPGTRQRVVLLLLPDVHLQDLAGPAQVFYEAAAFGAACEPIFASDQERVRSAQGLTLSELDPLPRLAPGDRILVPGIDSARLDRMRPPVEWLHDAHARGVAIGSICSGSFALARAGLLDGRRSTTHWKVADRLQRECPATEVLENRLFVKDGSIATSAGVTTGVDLALSLVHDDHGPRIAAQVAREMVVYMRREGDREQLSPFLEHRTHLHPGVHRTQDWLTAHPERNPTLEELGRIAGMSPRNLTRVFRRTTGVTIKEYASRIKLEIAGQLIERPDLTIESVSEKCGFRDPRQLRRLWKRRHGTNIAEWRRKLSDHARR